jgi:nitrogen fixation/metabolism regulation signal transduction histidine kinase
VTLRRKLLLYLAVLHIVFAASAIWFLRDHRIWVLPVEIFFVFSTVAGFRLVQSIFGPIELIRTGIQFIQESDFNSRFREVGQPEMDELTRVYNKMADHLREERIRVREKHHFLEEVIKASPSGIVTFDFDGRIAMLNLGAERMLGRPAAELLGKTVEEAGAPLLDAVTGLPVGESRIVPFQGFRRVRCHRSTFLDHGFPRSFLMFEELTEELRRSERAAYEKIIRIMSHEINNSIAAGNSLLESCQVYANQLRDEDRVDFSSALGVAIARGQRLNGFVKSYADVFRLPPPEPRPCDLRELLEDIAFLMSAECSRRAIEWRWEMPGEFQVAIDKNQMEQVFMNLFRNAVEAIGARGAITVRGGRGCLAIEDTGCGLTPEVQANLFTPFYSSKENGRGIGLTLVQEILTRHGFRFSLDGEPGRGARFTIWF